MSLEWNKKARGAVAMAMAIHRINRKEIAEQLGTSPSTLRAWIDQPGKMTVDNWTHLCNIVGLDRSTLQMKTRTATESTAKRETR
jgi:uncharacterized protein YjcR